MTIAEIDEVRQLAMVARHGDVANYSEAVHNWKTEPYQDAWAEAFDEENRLLIICPPDTYKSSTVQCWIEQKIGLDPNIRILWLMKAGSQAEARVMSVAETIEDNSVYHEAFHVEPDKNAKWSKTALYVKRTRHGPDPTLMGCGFNGPYQGMHFDVIIIDDPTNQEDVSSPATMERQRAKLRGVILDRLVESGRIVAIMTRWGEDDLVPTFKDIGFRIVTMPVMADYPWGPTISPTRFPLDRCIKLRHDKTDAIFDLTYMCDPSAVEGGIIRRDYIKYWASGPIPYDQQHNTVGLPLHNTVTFMAIDPAASLRTYADPTCIGTGVLDIKSRALYVVDLWTKRAPEHEVDFELKRRAAQTANLVKIGVETKGYQLTFLQRLRREGKLPVSELPYRTRRQSMMKAAGLDNDKTGRAFSVAQMFNANRLFLSKDLPYVDGVSVESELVSFPFAKHDDRLDVIAFLCAMADTYTGQKVRVKLGRR